MESWEAGTGWKAGTSVHHSPFTVDVYNHSQLAQQGSTATIGGGNGIDVACGDIDELLAVVVVESLFRVASALGWAIVIYCENLGRGRSSRKQAW